MSIETEPTVSSDPDAAETTQPDTSPETPAPPAPESSTERAHTTETPLAEGPLSSLAHKAAETPLGRKASQNMPDSARPTLDRASRVLNTVDEHLLAARDTLDTNEGRRVVNSACEFMSSVFAFATMLFTAGVSRAERKLGMETSNESSPKRFVKVCREAAKKVRAHAETREKKVDGSCEAWMYAHLRQAMDVIFSVFKSSLKGLSDFSGPGKGYVAPAADGFISMLPEDMQTDVRESQGPVESLRSGLGLERGNAPGEDSNQTARNDGGTAAQTRMKVD